MGQLVSIDPTTGDQLANYPEMTPEEVDRILHAAMGAWHKWRRTGFATRSNLLRNVAALLRQNSAEYAKLMAREMGKPISQGRTEVEKCAWTCDYFAEHAPQFLAPEEVHTDATRSFVAYQPLGVVLAVMPWNFPFWQVFRFVAPTLMAGNAAVLKHASNVTGCALAIEAVLHEAGFGAALFRTLRLASANLPLALNHPAVCAVTLTGSTPAGQSVASQAGAQLKKTVLELGGSDPYLILADADLDTCVPICASARMLNGGQSCIAAKRFIVVESLRAAFESALVERLRSLRLGNPLDEAVELGPMARRDLRDDLHRQVTTSLAAGARLLLGGQPSPCPGAFYPATVLTDVRPGMPAYDEELFGPVAAIVPVTDEAAAIRAANDTIFGLGAAVFTRDLAKGERIAAEELEAGCCFVNSAVKSDPRLPFGGIKQSGYGRELSVFGIREFTNIKTVFVK